MKEGWRGIKNIGKASLAVPLVIVLTACSGKDDSSKSNIQPDTGSTSNVPTATQSSEVRPTITPEPTKEIQLTPAQRISSYVKEVLKPEFIPQQIPAPTEGAVTIFNQTFKTFSTKADINGVPAELIYTESISGLPVDLTVQISYIGFKVPNSDQAEILKRINNSFVTPPSVSADSFKRIGLNLGANIYEAVWEDKDGTKDTRSLQYGRVSSEGIGEYYIAACKLFKASPLYAQGTCYNVPSVP